ncbi:disease resistance protein RPV1 [Pyrus x bretschneideri]|uniref:disease resistance protein RPV1 n=1 Tax=Pyrus x bretschneideri TaxID=225117 RepID=UPI00202DE6F6|nr:disease resistance protein RPV1 [Pyrus x bretschneideri]
MDLSFGGSSSFSGDSGCRYIYDVFLSFRGEDTRDNFGRHLYAALEKEGLVIFLDGDEVERGEVISRGVRKAIHKSRCSIVVFTECYASSRWCLDDLVMILESTRTSGQFVLPVFNGVDPYDVLMQTGSVAKAFARHDVRERLDKVKGWRAALTEAANLGGMIVQSEADGNASKFIENLVAITTARLRRRHPLWYIPYLVGIDSHLKDVNSWLQDEYSDIGMLVIHGMSGIGKTTIARHFYRLNAARFDECSFLENIRETSKKPTGLVHIQQKLLYDICGRIVKIHNVSEGIVQLRDAIKSERVFVVLDGLEGMHEFDAVINGLKDALFGSKIIITTTNARVLRAAQKFGCKVCTVGVLNYSDSLELFCWHAFDQCHPIEERYMEQSKRIVQHCGGLPLALTILGSALSGQSIDAWESTLNQQQIFPHYSTMERLKRSIYSLTDDHDRALFLHIACFFIGMDRDYVVRILDGCDFHTIVGMENLIEKCLLTTDRDNKLYVHPIFRDTGREIVRHENWEPWGRSRLWHDADSFRVLTKKFGTTNNPGFSNGIKGISFNMHMYSKSSSSDSNVAVFESNAFRRMGNLQLLRLSHVELNGCYAELPKGLRWLCWLEFPLYSIPDDLALDRLVVLEMQYSSLRQVWKGRKNLPSLKILDVSHSHDLTEVADLSLVPNLERLILKDCESLVGIHESIGKLEKLVYFNIKDCKSIQKFPKSMPKNLETLITHGCSNLEEFRIMQMRMMVHLKALDADEAHISGLVYGAQKSGLTLWDHTRFTKNIKLRVHVNLTHLLRGCEKFMKLIIQQYLDAANNQNKDLGEQNLKLISSEMVSLHKLCKVADSYSAGTACRDLISCQGSKIVEDVNLGEKAGREIEVADVEDEGLTESLKSLLFLYCSLFPLDYEFKKYELVQLWIAEGFLGERHRERMEDTGILYFNSMESEGFFVPSRSDFSVDFDSVFSLPIYNPSNFLYKINTIKLSVLEKRIYQDGYFRAVDGKLDGASEMTQHLSVIFQNMDEIGFGVLQKFQRLRTLLLFSGSRSSIKQVPRNLFLGLKFLRTLNLSGTLISELPSSIRNVKALRYLDVSHTPIRQLPEAIDSLHNLQTIKLRGCVNFVQLPKGIKKLTNLRHIELDIIRQLDSLPAYLGNLTNLQTLSAFLIGRDQGCHIGELKNLNHLKGTLRISRLENVLTKEEAEEASLSMKKSLQSVELRWSSLLVENVREEEKILECLQPHYGLQELEIQNYGGSILPAWISNPAFADLLVVTLYRCKNCELLPSLGQLPALKFLSIIEMNEVKEIHHQLFRNDQVAQGFPAFPKLERLEIDIMLNLKQWTAIKQGDLPSLLKLTVDSCPEFVTLPSLSELKSLKHLEFRRCPKLLPLPHDGLPTSLESLIIIRCPELKEWCTKGGGEDQENIWHVPSVWLDHEELKMEGEQSFSDA